MNKIILFFFLTLIFNSCTVPEDGTNGADGEAGADGIDGTNGISCWDLNGNGNADANEDTNQDGEYNTLDCQGSDGTNGVSCDDGNNPIYLSDNGITIKACQAAHIGDTGGVNGVTYTVVDNAGLLAARDAGEDLTKVVTTKVTRCNHGVR